MAAYCQGRVEFSPDALSNTTPTYVDVTSYVISASWSSGVSVGGDILSRNAG
jgi:hypothetical protein